MRILTLILLLSSAIWCNAQDGNYDVVTFEEFQNEYMVPGDNPVVFNFWATWCKPCVKELPHFYKAAEEHPEWDFVLVSLDFPRHLETKLKPFLIKNQVKIPVVVLNEGNANVFIDPIDPKWQGSIPATMVWDDKNVGFAEQEFHSYDELITFISQSINSKQ